MKKDLPEHPPVFLIGFMGAGKSTTGKLLAAALEYQFVDLDAAIELVAGKSVSGIFNEDGEKAFRRFEHDVLHQLGQRSEIVVATGGGCGADPENVNWMNQNGICIYLNAQPGVLFHRLAPQKNKRPLIAGLTDVSLMEYIMDLLSIRENSYRQAEYIVDGEKPARDVCREMMQRINHQSFSGLEERAS
jgi:shikimate kinase